MERIIFKKKTKKRKRARIKEILLEEKKQPRPSLADCEEDISSREDARVRQFCRNPCARAFYLSASIQTGIRCVAFVVVVVVCLCVCVIVVQLNKEFFIIVVCVCVFL
jgi:hypothetical protein